MAFANHLCPQNNVLGLGVWCSMAMAALGGVIAGVRAFAPHRARFREKRWCGGFVWCRREPKLVLRGV